MVQVKRFDVSIRIDAGGRHGEPGRAAPFRTGQRDVYYLSTGQSGAQTQIDVNHTTSWSFTATIGLDAGRWRFHHEGWLVHLGRHPAVGLQGTNASGTLLTSIDLSNTAVLLAAGRQQLPELRIDAFSFCDGQRIHLHLGLQYYIALTSTAPDVQSQRIHQGSSPQPSQTPITSCCRRNPDLHRRAGAFLAALLVRGWSGSPGRAAAAARDGSPVRPLHAGETAPVFD